MVDSEQTAMHVLVFPLATRWHFQLWFLFMNWNRKLIRIRKALVWRWTSRNIHRWNSMITVLWWLYIILHHLTLIRHVCHWYFLDPASSFKNQWKATAQESQRTLLFLHFGWGTTGNEIESCYVFCWLTGMVWLYISSLLTGDCFMVHWVQGLETKSDLPGKMTEKSSSNHNSSISFDVLTVVLSMTCYILSGFSTSRIASLFVHNLWVSRNFEKVLPVAPWRWNKTGLPFFPVNDKILWIVLFFDSSPG